ncbi:hypothetical protein KM043_001520 [Ampulex compressa]|nr:hypothetical protein KM043_001520 [Ampulex compressa]
MCYTDNSEDSTGSETRASVEAIRDKLLYCDYLDKEKVKVGHMKLWLRKLAHKRMQKMQETRRLVDTSVYSVLLDNDEYEKYTAPVESDRNDDVQTVQQKPVHMPYTRVDRYESVEDEVKTNKGPALNETYKALYERYLETKSRTENEPAFDADKRVGNVSYGESEKEYLSRVPPRWMTDYEQFNDGILDEEDVVYYGTPNPEAKISTIPCGGCGAILHCRDAAIPGYLPSELYLHRSNDDLKAMICQRCHFLKYYNTALEVKVSSEEYSELLKVIKRKKCAVILMVDLTDFPCSIWPDLKSVLHSLTPIYIVGNKVDLLPQDCSMFLDYVKEYLSNTVQDYTGIESKMIKHVALISAKTGYGVEELISKLQSSWRYKGDVYVIGCTNVGKSSLFNALIRSDYCKVQAIDLIQRATTSPWPGTTLNLLKFPIMNPLNWRLALRAQRLRTERVNVQAAQEWRNEKYKMSRNIIYATLEGRIGRTFESRDGQGTGHDPFSQKSYRHKAQKLGLDETRPEYRESKWCYDTPGTIQPDQILDLLTTEELFATLPRKIISPRTFLLRPLQTLFLAGLGRLDYTEGEEFIRCTVFASAQLPITICRTVDANDVYDRLLVTEALVVPTNHPARLKMWPGLRAKEIKVTGIKKYLSAADVVLSSAGWIAITCADDQSVTLKAWTPEGRGLYLRSPALLRRSVAHRGDRVSGTSAYRLGNQVCKK